MLDDYAPVVKKISQVTGYDGTGKAVDSVRVEYWVGIHGPFYETLSKADFKGPKLQADMQATANQIRALGATSTQ